MSSGGDMYVQYAAGVPFGAKYCNWGWGWKSSFFGGRQGVLESLVLFSVHGQFGGRVL